MAKARNCRDIRLDSLLLTDVTRSDSVLLARTDITDVPHHATLVRVRDIPDDGGIRQVAVDDPDGHLNYFHGADPGADGPLWTIRLPGHAGDWVLLISPFAR
jgi:hypothetical protein